MFSDFAVFFSVVVWVVVDVLARVDTPKLEVPNVFEAGVYSHPNRSFIINPLGMYVHVSTGDRPSLWCHGLVCASPCFAVLPCAVLPVSLCFSVFFSVLPLYFLYGVPVCLPCYSVLPSVSPCFCCVFLCFAA